MPRVNGSRKKVEKQFIGKLNLQSTVDLHTTSDDFTGDNLQLFQH
jgi:hypothetical protein